MLAKTYHQSTRKLFFYTLSEHRTSVESITKSFPLQPSFYFALQNKRGVNGMVMGGRGASNANQGFRGVFD